MNYTLNILKSAQTQLSKIENRDQQAIVSEIRKLKEQPRPAGCKKLTGRDAWRIRVGNYRVIYEISDTTLSILVITLGHRKEVYK